MKEPKRNTDINSLEPYLIPRVQAILDGMKKRGFDPIIFEARRTGERQFWLMTSGNKNHKPVTWTLKSKHIIGKAVDIISKKNLWLDAKFYKALKQEAKKQSMHTISREQCHLQWEG